MTTAAVRHVNRHDVASAFEARYILRRRELRAASGYYTRSELRSGGHDKRKGWQ